MEGWFSWLQAGIMDIAMSIAMHAVSGPGMPVQL